MGASRDSAIQLVCGKKIVEVDGADFRREASLFHHVVLDLGAGDGRFAYRLARAHPAWLCVAVDANARAMVDCSYRAGRKPTRGGTANVRFVRAAVEGLPLALDGIADEITVLYPWGSLLKAVILPQPEVLASIARLGKPGAYLRLRVNLSAVSDPVLSGRLGVPVLAEADMNSRLATAYEDAGIRIVACRSGPADARTSWARRLGHGGPIAVLALDGVIGGS